MLLPIHRRGGVVAHAIVDDEDFITFSEFRWRCLPNGSVVRTSGYGLYLHRLVMGLTRGDGLTVDHVNRDRLDNRRANLRVCTIAQNSQNVGTRHAAPRNVYWNRRLGKWQALVCLSYKQTHLGFFDSVEEADTVARAWRAQHMPFATA